MDPFKLVEHFFPSTRTFTQEARALVVLAAVGGLLASLGLLALAQTVWKKPTLKDRSLTATVVIMLLGLSLGGYAGIMLKTRPNLHVQLIQTPDGQIVQAGTSAGQPESEQVNADELKKLQSASLDAQARAVSWSASWPQWRGPQRDAVSAEHHLLRDWRTAPPRVLWKQPLGPGFSSMAIANGLVYTMDSSGDPEATSLGTKEQVLCFDAVTGKKRWSYAYRANYSTMAQFPGPRATPAVFDGRLYTVGGTGIMICFDAQPAGDHAKVLWQCDLMEKFDAHHPGWGVTSSPLIEGDLVCVQPGGKKGSIVALDRRTGKRVWTALREADHHPVEQSGYSSPVAATVAGVRQIIAMTGKGVVGLRAADGGQLWYFSWPTQFNGNIATPIVAGDYVFISSAYDAGCALLHVLPDPSAGVRAEPVYVKHNRLMRNHHSSCVFHDGFLYGFDCGPGLLKCVDLRSGQEKWSSRQVDKGCLLWADGHLIIQTETGHLALVEATPDGFHAKGQLSKVLNGNQCWALPALADGRLYIRDGEQLICLDLRKQALKA